MARQEVTLKNNTRDKDELLVYIKQFSQEISTILASKNTVGKTITLKYKTSEFQSHTRSRTLLHYISSKEEIYEIGKEILEAEDLQQDLRLIGITISSFKESEMEQLRLF